MKSLLFRSLPALYASMIFSVLPMSAAVLYQDTFETSTFGSSWMGYRGAAAVNAVAATGASADFAADISLSAASGPAGGLSGGKYLFVQNKPAANVPSNYLVFSTATVLAFGPIAPLGHDGLTATWNANYTYQANVTPATAPSLYFAVQVSGSPGWYVTPASTPALYDGVTATNAAFSVDLLLAQWYSLNFAIGSPLVLTDVTPDTTATLFAGGKTITGVGFYVAGLQASPGSADAGYATTRLDNLTIAGVPEPGRGLLVLGGMACLLFRRRRA